MKRVLDVGMIMWGMNAESAKCLCDLRAIVARLLTQLSGPASQLQCDAGSKPIDLFTKYLKRDRIGLRGHSVEEKMKKNDSDMRELISQQGHSASRFNPPSTQVNPRIGTNACPLIRCSILPDPYATPCC